MNYDNIKEGEKKQISKVEREIDGIKYWEYTYITKLENGRIHKQTVKTKYKPKDKTEKKKSKSKSSDSENEISNNEKIKKFVDEYKKQMYISLQNLIKIQFNKTLTIEELKNLGVETSQDI